MMIESPLLDSQTALDISEEILAIDWTLTPEDINIILSNCRGPSENYLRFAIQLCMLRKEGRFLQDYSQVPVKAVQYLTRQLECDPVLFVPQPERLATEYDYRHKICCHLGFRDFDLAIENQLAEWIANQLQKEFCSQDNLFKKAETFLLSQKVLLPAAAELKRKVMSIRKESCENIYEKIANKITQRTRQAIKKLLHSPKESTLSALQHYKRYPPEPKAKVINEFIDRLEVLQQLGIQAIDLSDINPTIIDEFYRLASTYNARDLRRLKPENKRYALLICFLVESYKLLLDHVLDLNDKMLIKKERISRNQFKKKAKQFRRKSKECEKSMINALEKLFSHKDPEKTTIETFTKESIAAEKVKKAVQDCKALIQQEEQGVLHELEARYPDLRKYTTRFYDLDFKAAPGSEWLLGAIKTLRQFNQGDLKSLPVDVPIHFIPRDWEPLLHNSDGSIHQRVWELALYFAAQKAINTGDLYLPYSRHHINFWETIYQEKAWKQEKEAAYTNLLLPDQFDPVLDKLIAEFNQSIRGAKKNLNKNSFAYIGHNGKLKLRRDDALDIPDSTKKLRQLIEARLPIIRIEELLKEVDTQVNFSKLFVAPAGYAQKSQIPTYLLYAAILAHGSNIGLYNMAHSADDITVDDLRHASRWLIHQKTLKTANTHLINAQLLLPLSHIYGDKELSSSDAKRYPIRTSSLLASYYPRYFGYYDKAISIYTHTSNLYSVFCTQVISCSTREALYVLDGLLSNDSLLTPHIHCTDTHGFTHHIFGLCYLLGFSFQPRLKDLASQKLYKLDKSADYGKLDSLFSGHINIELIREQWDQLARIAASLKNHLAPAHIIVSKLANRTSYDKAAKALMELGKMIKTIFILRYIADSKMRHKIHLQLNRGESRHSLAQHIFFADQGIFKTNDYEEIMNKASCLSFLSNAVVYWNTLQIAKIVNDLKAEGYPVADTDLARISPLMFKHIIMHGTYWFNERHKNRGDAGHSLSAITDKYIDVELRERHNSAK